MSYAKRLSLLGTFFPCSFTLTLFPLTRLRGRTRYSRRSCYLAFQRWQIGTIKDCNIYTSYTEYNSICTCWEWSADKHHWIVKERFHRFNVHGTLIQDLFVHGPFSIGISAIGFDLWWCNVWYSFGLDPVGNLMEKYLLWWQVACRSSSMLESFLERQIWGTGIHNTIYKNNHSTYQWLEHLGSPQLYCTSVRPEDDWV